MANLKTRFAVIRSFHFGGQFFKGEDISCNGAAEYLGVRRDQFFGAKMFQ